MPSPRRPSLALAVLAPVLALLAPSLTGQDPAQTTVIPLLGEGDTLPASGLTMVSIPAGPTTCPGASPPRSRPWVWAT